MTHRSDDMGDAHERVIDGDAEVVDRQAVAPQNDKVAQVVGVEGDIAPDPVRDDHLLVGRHPEPVAVGCSLVTTKQHSCQCIDDGPHGHKSCSIL